MLILSLTLLLAPGPAASARDYGDVAATWALVGATTAEGESYTPEQIEAVFGSANYTFVLYESGIYVNFVSGMMNGGVGTYEVINETEIILSALPDNPFYLDESNPFYMYFTADDGSEYVFSRETPIEGMWIATGASNEDTALTDEEFAAQIGVRYILIFNYNCSIDIYNDGQDVSDGSEFSYDAEGNIVVYTPEGSEYPVLMDDEEHFTMSTDTASLHFTRIYPIIGEWALSYAVFENGSFATEQDITDLFGTTDVRFVIAGDGSIQAYLDGEAAGEGGTVSVRPEGEVVVTLTDGSEESYFFDTSANMLTSEIADGYFIFTRTTGIVLPE